MSYRTAILLLILVTVFIYYDRHGDRISKISGPIIRHLVLPMPRSTDPIIRYHVEPPPRLTEPSIPMKALKQAIRLWEEGNEITFVQALDGDYDTLFKWQRYPDRGQAGYAVSEIRNGKKKSTVHTSLGDDDCKDNYIQRDIGAVTNIIMHEIGHTLGLEHTGEEAHLMYGRDDQVIPYDELGYRIPKKMELYFVGWKSLSVQHDELKIEYKRLQSGHDKKKLDHELLQMKYDSLKRQYDGTDKMLYQQINRYVANLNENLYVLNRTVDKINTLASRMNVIVSKQMCYPNVDWTARL